MQKFPGDFHTQPGLRTPTGLDYIALGEKEGRLYVTCWWYKQHLFRPSVGNVWNACLQLRKVNSTFFLEKCGVWIHCSWGQADKQGRSLLSLSLYSAFALFSGTAPNASSDMIRWFQEGFEHWYLLKAPFEIPQSWSLEIWMQLKGNNNVSLAFLLSQLGSPLLLDSSIRRGARIVNSVWDEKRECVVHCAKQWRVRRAAEPWSSVTPRGISPVSSGPPFLRRWL